MNLLEWFNKGMTYEEYTITSLRAALPEADAPDFEEKQKTLYKTFKKTITTDPAIWRTMINSMKERFNGTK